VIATGRKRIYFIVTSSPAPFSQKEKGDFIYKLIPEGSPALWTPRF
jgi:hypothetical protein